MLRAAVDLADEGALAGEHPRRLGRRGGDRRHVDRRLGQRRRAWGRRVRDLRRRHGTPRRPAVLHRHARARRVRPVREDRRARPALRHVRQRSAERDPRAHAGARRDHARATGGSPSRCAQGIIPASPEEQESWSAIPSGEEMLGEAGASPYDERAADEFWLRTTAESSVDVNGILGGKPGLKNTTTVTSAQANFTVRLAPGQDVETIREAVEQLVSEAAPEGAEVEHAASTGERRRRSSTRSPQRSSSARRRSRRCSAASRCSCAAAARCRSWRRSRSAGCPSC